MLLEGNDLRLALGCTAGEDPFEELAYHAGDNAWGAHSRQRA
jgi:hypothetical protein